LVSGTLSVTNKRINTGIGLRVAKAVVNSVLVLSSPLSTVGGVLDRPGLGIKRVVLALRDDLAVGHLCSQKISIEELADLGRGTILRSCGEVVLGLSIAVLSTLINMPGAGENLGSHVRVVALSIIGSIDGELAKW
jgi:hypothetical protein